MGEDRAPFADRLAELPVLGVGASVSFGVEPDPVALAARAGGPSFIEYAGAVQPSHLEPALGKLRRDGVPLLYHPSCLNLCGPFANPPAWIEAVDHHVAHVGSAWLAQDVSICFVGETPGYSIQLGYFVPPILTRASLEQAVERVAEVTAGVRVPLLLEPAPVTFYAGEMSIFAWLSELAQRTECGLLIDAGHVVSHQLARHRADLDAGLDELDTSRVVEIHVAGGVIHEREDARFYQDAHDLPILPETWHVFRSLLERCTELRAVCVECEGALAQSILPVLEKTRLRVVDGSVSEPLRAKVGADLDEAGALRP